MTLGVTTHALHRYMQRIVGRPKYTPAEMTRASSVLTRSLRPTPFKTRWGSQTCEDWHPLNGWLWKAPGFWALVIPDKYEKYDFVVATVLGEADFYDRRVTPAEPDYPYAAMKRQYAGVAA